MAASGLASPAGLRCFWLQPHPTSSPVLRSRSTAAIRSWREANFAQTKSPGETPGLQVRENFLKSVLRDHRATEVIVHADCADVDVLSDVVGRREHAGGRVCRDILAAQEHVIVFECDGPVWREPELKPNANHATPTVLAGGVDRSADHGNIRIVPVVHHGRATLHVAE